MNIYGLWKGLKEGQEVKHIPSGDIAFRDFDQLWWRRTKEAVDMEQAFVDDWEPVEKKPEHCNLEPCITPVLRTCITVNSLKAQLEAAKARLAETEADGIYAAAYKEVLRKFDIDDGFVAKYIEGLWDDLQIAKRESANYKKQNTKQLKRISAQQLTIDVLNTPKIKVLLIRSAGKPTYWYADKIGQTVPYLKDTGSMYASTTFQFVDYEDAILLEI